MNQAYGLGAGDKDKGGKDKGGKDKGGDGAQAQGSGWHNYDAERVDTLGLYKGVNKADQVRRRIEDVFLFDVNEIVEIHGL